MEHPADGEPWKRKGEIKTGSPTAHRAVQLLRHRCSQGVGQSRGRATCGGFLAFVERPAHFHSLPTLLDLLLRLPQPRSDLARKRHQRKSLEAARILSQLGKRGGSKPGTAPPTAPAQPRGGLLLTCCMKLALTPGMGRFEGAMGRWSRGEPVLILLSVRE